MTKEDFVKYGFKPQTEYGSVRLVFNLTDRRQIQIYHIGEKNEIMYLVRMNMYNESEEDAAIEIHEQRTNGFMYAEKLEKIISFFS